MMTHDLSVAFDMLVKAAGVRGHGTEPLTTAAIAYVAQLAIDLGGYDATIIRRFESDLSAKAKAMRDLREAVKPVDFRPHFTQVMASARGQERPPRFKVWLADEDQLGDLVLRTGSRDLKPSQYDLDFGGTTPEEVAITAYKRLNSTDPVTFIVKNFDNGKFHTVVVTPAGAASCVEKRDASRDEDPL